MEPTQPTVPLRASTPKFVKIVMIVYIVLGSILVLLGLLEGNILALFSPILWFICLPSFVLRCLKVGMIKSYRVAGLIAIVTVINALSDLARASAQELGLSGQIAALIIIVVWFAVYISLNKNFKKAFPGKKLLAFD